MSVDFAEVTDITIPQGEVTKIEETATGRVLWQKGLVIPKAHWEIIELPSADINGEAYDRLLTSVDTDDGIEIFTTDGRHFKYNADGTVGEISLFQNMTTTNCADIDPVTKKWIVFGGKYYASNAFSSTKELEKVKHMCCWSPKLECFCAIGPYDAVLIGLNGEIKAISQEVSFSMLNVHRRYEGLIWADTLNKFVLPGSTSLNQYVCFSSDGLNWETKEVKIAGSLPDFQTGEELDINIHQIRWMPTVKKFISSCTCRRSGETTGKFYSIVSTDCVEWRYLRKTPTAVDIKSAYSSEKKVFAIANVGTSYVTRDEENWVEVPYIEDIPHIARRSMKWSKSLNGFICISNENVSRFYKLVIEN